MIQVLSRRNIFKQSKMADIEVAARQRFYFEQFTGEDPELIKSVMSYYDHREPAFHLDGHEVKFCVLVYDEELSGKSYENGFATGFVHFLSELNIEQVILMQDLCSPWNEFGFDTVDGQDGFQKITKENGTNGFLLDHKALLEIFPLLYHNNPDKGDCSFYTCSTDMQLGILFWKGHLHILYYEKDIMQILAAAQKSGFIMGDRELAFNYSYGVKYNT